MSNNRDLEIRVIGRSRSSKLVPFESLGAVSYSPSIVTMAVSVTVYEIFSVKIERHLENWVSGCSRSLKVAPFNRPYDFLLVRHCKYYSSILYHFWAIWRWVISQSWNLGHSRSLKLVSLSYESLSAVSYSPSIANMALSYIISDKARYWSKIVIFFMPPCIGCRR